MTNTSKHTTVGLTIGQVMLEFTGIVVVKKASHENTMGINTFVAEQQSAQFEGAIQSTSRQEYASALVFHDCKPLNQWSQLS